MNNQWNEKDYAEIDLRALARTLYKQRGFILIFTLGLMLLMALISFCVLPPIYQAQTSLLVLPGDLTSKSSSPDSSNLQGVINSMSKLPELTINTYVQQTKDPVLLSKIITELDLASEGYTIKKLGSTIKASAIKDTNLIEIKVQNKNPDLAISIVRTLTSMLLDSISQSTQEQINKTRAFLQEQAEAINIELRAERAKLRSLETRPQGTNTTDNQDVVRRIAELERTLDLLSEKIIVTQITKSVNLWDTSLQVISPAILLERPVKPNKILNTILAGLGGLIAVTFFVLIREGLNNKLKTSDEVEKQLGLPVFGIIPKFINKELGVTPSAKEAEYAQNLIGTIK